jgi:hypothetical protein
MRRPDALHAAMADPGGFRHRSARPMRRFARWFGERHLDHPFDPRLTVLQSVLVSQSERTPHVHLSLHSMPRPFVLSTISTALSPRGRYRSVPRRFFLPDVMRAPALTASGWRPVNLAVWLRTSCMTEAEAYQSFASMPGMTILCLKVHPNQIDRNDAAGLVQIIRTGSSKSGSSPTSATNSDRFWRPERFWCAHMSRSRTRS